MVAKGIYNYHEDKDAEGKSYSPRRWDCYINVPGSKRPLHRRFRGTKRECDSFCIRIRREAESGIRPDADRVTVAEFMENVHAYNQSKAYLNTLFESPTMTNNVYLDALSRSPNHHQRITRHGAKAVSRKGKAHCNDLQGREVFSQ